MASPHHRTCGSASGGSERPLLWQAPAPVPALVTPASFPVQIVATRSSRRYLQREEDEAYYLCLNCPNAVSELKVAREQFLFLTLCQREFRDTYGEKWGTLVKDYKRLALGLGFEPSVKKWKGSSLLGVTTPGALANAHARVSDLEQLFNEQEADVASRSRRISRLLAIRKKLAESQQPTKPSTAAARRPPHAHPLSPAGPPRPSRSPLR